jgi:hypothetical protein
MTGVDKVAVFAVVCGGAALSVTCLLPIDELLQDAARPDGGAGRSATTGEVTDTVSTSAASGGAAGGSAPTASSSGGGAGGSLPLTCIADGCPSLGCVVEDGAKSEAPKNISAMVVSGSSLFWMSTPGNKIWRRKLDEPSATLFADGLAAPSAIDVNATDLFFADNMGIWWCSIGETDCTAHKTKGVESASPSAGRDRSELDGRVLDEQWIERANREREPSSQDRWGEAGRGQSLVPGGDRRDEHRDRGDEVVLERGCQAVATDVQRGV